MTTTPRYPGTNRKARRGDTVLMRNAEGYHVGTVTRLSRRNRTVTVANPHRTATVPVSDVVQVELTRPGLLARLFRR